MADMYFMQEAIENLIEQFETQKLPKEKWTHQAHLFAAVWHLFHYPHEEALHILRGKIMT